ncbi:hypothetical protein M011DRAFT_475599 [Sporormia fimetaria CBS 119925]|uniref:GAT domain-containing protein n=1 Tax=Sporormia fimetaria CBS 119925 TaxID=1340428 RepID=A0A6A6VK65_9PLEO|nr:hypothetical protein M011DRAFT_475599 [Sporormia fimetaria CBS 119925]
MVLKRLGTFGSLIKRSTSHDDAPPAEGDSPEATVVRAVRAFCDSGAANSGEEVLYLPAIVESAVASPQAAQAACHQIRKFLSKDYYSQPHVQYNAVMLIRILVDNPGDTFSKNIDKNFADTVKHLLRNGQDPSVAQILRESLDALDRDKAYDTNLTTLFAMWRKEKGLMANAAKQFGPRKLNAPAWNGQHQHQGFSGHHNSRTLPPPAELSGRIEEARTSAKLLLQLVQSTPANELLSNELVKEFSERCMSAQRSIQGYINCDNPAPDDDTMLTLIETNEQLSLAASKHQRAVLQARKLLGSSPSPPVPAPNSSSFQPPAASNSHTPPPASACNPPPQPPRNQAPFLPPLHVGQRDPSPPQSNKRDTMHKELPLPPALQAGGNRQSQQIRPVQEDDDPFADHHSSGYAPPPGPPPQASGSENQAPPSLGYQSTPSYLGRQESSVNNLSMHGASHAPLSPDDNRPRTPENTRNRRDSEVSPVADRTPITYRY